MQLCGCHGEHFSAGFEFFLRDRKGDPELIAVPLGIDACANDETRFDFLFRLQEADVVDLRLIVDRENPAFPAVIDGDLVSVDGFDKPVKCLTRFILSGNSAGGKGQADGDDDECQVGFHKIDFLAMIRTRYYFD